MRVRRTWLLGLSCVLLFSDLQAFSAVSPKAGAPCTKVGLTQTYNGKKYACIKSGKKLIWNNGVLVVTIQPTPTPSRSIAPTSSPLPTPVTSVTPTPTSSMAPKEPSSFDDLIDNYQGISLAAWRKSREKILTSSKTQIDMHVILGPNSKLTYTSPLKSIDLITRLFSGFANPTTLNYLAFSFEDRDWAIDQMEKTIPNSGSRWIKDVACASQPTCWGGGAFSDGKDKYLVVVALGSTDDNHTSGTLEAHEFTHIVQQMTMKAARPAQAFLYDPWPPDWYWEGQAQFAQNMSIYSDSYSDYMKWRRAGSDQLFNDPSFKSQLIKDYFVFNAPQDWQTKYAPWRKYDLGAMFVEILTALKGPDSTMEMWRIASTGVKFDTAFERVYGIPFSKALPIMAKAIALELGHDD